MSITLHLTTEEETRLRQAAATAGTDVDAYIRQRIFATANNLALRDDLSFLRQVGTTAIRDAQNQLMAQGIDYVYRRADGMVVRHMPDGTEELLAPSGL
jgi:hypothetical protein